MPGRNVLDWTTLLAVARLNGVEAPDDEEGVETPPNHGKDEERVEKKVLHRLKRLRVRICVFSHDYARPALARRDKPELS